MKAIVVNEFKESELKNVACPEPSGDEVLVSIDIVQLSVTECLQYRGAETSSYAALRERLGNEARLFGHEFSGTVVDRGAEVTAYELGDRVFAPGKVVCDDCIYCDGGFSHLCQNKEHLGKDRPGALAEYIALPERALCEIPDGVTDAEGAALQPLVSSFASTHSADLSGGETVAIVGTGVMGYQCGQLALEHGAKKVFAIDLVPHNLELAEEKGMIPIKPDETDPVEVIRRRTDEIGVDVVFECVGGAQERGTSGDDPLAQAFEMVRYDGRIVQTGYISGEILITPRKIRSKCIDWINPTRGNFPVSVTDDAGSYVTELVASDRISIEELVTTKLDGLESFEEAVEMNLNKDKHRSLGPPQIIVK